MVHLDLPDDEALVLFDWLARFNDADNSELHPGEAKALALLEGRLETQLVAVVQPDYVEQLARARARVVDR